MKNSRLYFGKESSSIDIYHFDIRMSKDFKPNCDLLYFQFDLKKESFLEPSYIDFYSEYDKLGLRVAQNRVLGEPYE